MKVGLSVIVLSLSLGCSYDNMGPFFARNDAIAGFLINYVDAQSHNFDLARRYDPHLTPGNSSEDWIALEKDYALVRSYQYRCQFDVGEKRFSVTCNPDSSLHIKLSFYADENRWVRVSGSGVAGASSPQVKLDSDQRQKLFRHGKP